MNEIVKKKKPFYTKKWVWGVGMLLVVLVLVFTRGGGGNPPEFSSAATVRKDLSQTVSETGSVVANLQLNYGFEISGRVASVEKKVGDALTVGDLIGSLEDAKQQAALKEARSALASAAAKLNLELAGPSEEEAKQSAATVDQARASLVEAEASLEKAEAKAENDVTSAEKAVETAQNNLQLAEGGEDSQIVNDAYEDLVNALKSGLTNITKALIESDNILGVDNMLANDEFEDYLSILDNSHLNRAEMSYIFSKNTRDAVIAAVVPLTLSSTHEVVDAATLETQDALTTLQIHLSDVQQVLNATVPTGDLSKSELDALKSSITTEQTSIDSSATNVANMRQAVTSARNSLLSYQIAYDKAVADLQTTIRQSNADIAIANANVAARMAIAEEKEAAHNQLIQPPRAVDIASLRADVARQSANVEALQSDFEKTRLTALSDGILARLDVEVGENVTANQEIVTIVSPQLTVEVDISESDIAKVAVGDPVSMTLDAFGDERLFSGSVASIDPAETEISGVIYYHTDIRIDLADGETVVRPGMTANVDIMTDMREQVLIIPRRAILERDGRRFVRVLTDEKTAAYEEREVTTGLRGDNGEIEILSGLQEGENIITFIREEE